MEKFLTILEYADIAAFAALAVVTFRQWRVRRDEMTRWAALTFGVLAAVAIAGQIIPEESDREIVEFLDTLVVAVIVLFPYFLYRVAHALRRLPSMLGRLVVVAMVTLVIWALALPEIPDEGEPRPDSFSFFIAALLVYWVALSIVVAVQFWRGSRSRPPIERRRMRMLSLASLALSVGIVVAGTASDEHATYVDVIVQGFALISVVAFFVAFAPPSWLRMIWRRPAQDQARRATVDLFAARSRDEVVKRMLPQALDVVGGEAIVMFDSAHEPIGSHGMDADEVARARDLVLKADGSSSREAELVHLSLPSGSFVVRTRASTPFFGQDEIELLGALGSLAALALERLDALEMRFQIEQAGLRRRQALEINDDVVQSLAVARYAFELNDYETARGAVDSALRAARRIVSELISELEDREAVGPGFFVRTKASAGVTDKPTTPDD